MITTSMKSQISLAALSSSLLLTVKLKKDTTLVEHQLRFLSLKELQHQLNNDTAKKAFWINIYNAYFQLLFNSGKTKRKTIFTEKFIEIAQNKFSLDDIEHGILRRF